MSEKNIKKEEKPVNQYAKYSGLAFQLFASLAVAGFIGQKMDKYFALSHDYITVFLILLVFFGIMYKVVKDLS